MDAYRSVWDAGPSDLSCAISMTVVKVPRITTWRLHNKTPPHTHTHSFSSVLLVLMDIAWAGSRIMRYGGLPMVGG